MPSNYCDNYNKTAAGNKDEDTSDTAALLLNNSMTTNGTNGHQGHYQGFNETLDLDIDALGIIDSTLGEETTNPTKSHSATNHALTYESEVRLYF